MAGRSTLTRAMPLSISRVRASLPGLGRLLASARILDSRVHSGAAVTQAVEDAGKRPRVVVQASGVGFYGPRGDEAIDETAAPGDDFLAQVCIAWEATADPLDALGVRRVIIRTGHVLSRTGGLLPYVVLPYRLWLGGPLGNGRQGQPWIPYRRSRRCRPLAH